MRNVAANYQQVGAGQVDAVLGSNRGAADFLNGLLVIPSSTSPGPVSVKDGDGEAITLFAGGAGSVSNLVPFFIFLGIASAGGVWKVTTGADISVLASGNFQ